MDSSMVYRLTDKMAKVTGIAFVTVLIVGISLGGYIFSKPSKPTVQKQAEYVAPATCVWIRESHQATQENGVPPNVKYNCWSSVDGAWQGYVEEQQSGDWYNAHVPDYKTDEHADKYDTYGTLAQAEAHVEQAWHAKVAQ